MLRVVGHARPRGTAEEPFAASMVPAASTKPTDKMVSLVPLPFVHTPSRAISDAAAQPAPWGELSRLCEAVRR